VLLLEAVVVRVPADVDDTGALEVTRVLLLLDVEVEEGAEDVAAAPGRHWK
jgi:hypothetical protein